MNIPNTKQEIKGKQKEDYPCTEKESRKRIIPVQKRKAGRGISLTLNRK